MLPIVRVVVMEDRAQVERAGSVTLAGGVTKIEVPAVAPVIVDRSLKVEVRGGQFVDARVERRWRERPAGGLPADASELRRTVDTLEQQLREHDDDVTRIDAEVELLQAARADVLRSIAQLAGFGKSDPSWATQLDAVSTRQADVDERLRLARIAREACATRLSQARTALHLSEEKDSNLECLLIVTLEGNGPAEVKVSYLVPCAVWRPSYRATLRHEVVLLEAEAMVWQRTGEDWSSAALAFSTARPTLGTTPPMLTEDRVVTRPKASIEKQVVDVAIREEVIQHAGEASTGNLEMPGLDDGGEVRLLVASAPMTVKSDGQPHRVPLFSFESRATLERVCPAEFTSLVSLVARFVNGSGQALLAGPVTLSRNNGFVGRSQLAFAAPQETVKLSFGSEDGLQVRRTTEEKNDEARLTGRRTTTRKVELRVSNARNDGTRLIIEERVPVSEVKEVEVQVLTKACQPVPAVVTKDGIARIELELPPNGTRVATFAWELSAASKVAGV